MKKHKKHKKQRVFGPGEYEEEKQRIKEESLREYRIQFPHSKHSQEYSQIKRRNLNSSLLMLDEFECPRCENKEVKVKGKDLSCPICDFNYTI
jgi:rubrerythrin